MTLTYPTDGSCDTPGEKLALLERAKEIFKLLHNGMNKWKDGGLTLTQYNKLPESIKSRYAYVPNISFENWSDFNSFIMEKLNDKIGNQWGVQKQAAAADTKFDAFIGDIGTI